MVLIGKLSVRAPDMCTESTSVWQQQTIRVLRRNTDALTGREMRRMVILILLASDGVHASYGVGEEGGGCMRAEALRSHCLMPAEKQEGQTVLGIVENGYDMKGSKQATSNKMRVLSSNILSSSRCR